MTYLKLMIFGVLHCVWPRLSAEFRGVPQRTCPRYGLLSQSEVTSKKQLSYDILVRILLLWSTSAVVVLLRSARNFKLLFIVVLCPHGQSVGWLYVISVDLSLFYQHVPK